MPLAVQLRPALLALMLVTAILPPAAHAGPSQLSMLQDDVVLLHRGAVERAADLQRMQALGVDYARVTVEAVGTRYSGTYRDENEGEGTLPRVAFWSLYDEPNQGARLTPQVERGVPWSPVMYRELWAAGRAALDATGHVGDPVLIGETAAAGSTPPAAFVRELFCVGPDGRPHARRAARVRRCPALRRLGRLRTAAWSHHPDAGGSGEADPGSITMANVAELGDLLDRMAAVTGQIAARKAIVLSGLGYDSAPPDPVHGVPLTLQAASVNEADHAAYRDPRVIGHTQSLPRDAPPTGPGSSARAWATRQSGLDFADGTPKPAADAYRLPLVASTLGEALEVWGQLRFLPNGRASQVSLEFRPAGEAAFRTAGAPVPVTSALGFFEARRPAPGPGTLRAVWSDPGTGAAVWSREIGVE